MPTAPLLRILSCLLLAAAGPCEPVRGQALTEPGETQDKKTIWDYPHDGEPPIPRVKPLLEVGLRDTAITRGEDGYFYLTGTIGPDFMTANAGVPLWRSRDLVTWEDLGLVWTFERDATWQKEWTTKRGQRRRALWAPEMHNIKGGYYIAYCVTGLGTGVLRSASGRPGGPYVDINGDAGPLTSGIDASLFVDDDGSVYFIYGSGYIAKMKDDMSGLAERPVRLRCEPADMEIDHHHPARPCLEKEWDHVGFEGAFMFKAGGRYYLSAAERYRERYHAMTAEATNLRGPYSARYVSVPYAGHNTFFQDHEGRWWSTIFGNDQQAPIDKKPGIIPVETDPAGHIRPVVSGEAHRPPVKK